MTKPLITPPRSKNLATGLLSRPYFILVLTPLFWGGNMVAGKLAVGQIDPYAFVTFRWIGAFFAILPFALGPLRRDRAVLSRSWPLLVLFGGLGFATFNILIYLAAHRTTAVNISIEQASIPVLVMLGNFILFGVRARLLQIAGVILTIAGVIVTATHGDPSRILLLTINSGDAMVLAACLAYAAYSLMLRFRPPVHWMSFLLVTFAGALLTSILFQLLFGGGSAAFFSAFPAITARGWLLVLYVVLFPSVLSQLFYARGVELIGANRASLFINLIPVFGTILSVIIIGERFETYHLFASFLVITGIVLAEYAVRHSFGRGDPPRRITKVQKT